MAASFWSFVFKLRFDMQSIAAVSHEEQLTRVGRYLHALAGLHPRLANWYLQGASVREALGHDVLSNPQTLSQAAAASHVVDYPNWLSLSVWNGIEDPLQGGLTFSYDAHDMDSISSMDFEDAGALVCSIDNPRDVLVEMLRLAVTIWKEVDWAVIASGGYYLDKQVFPDRQTIGWSGFCPHTLNPVDFPEADNLIDIPGRGTLVISCSPVMDEHSREHFKKVGAIDTKLVELGLLPFFNG